MTGTNLQAAALEGPLSLAALDICRGVTRLLLSHGITSLCELPLPNARRVDVIGLTRDGDIWIVEIKSSIEDFRSDNKWHEYQGYCDRLFFAVAPTFPQSILPDTAGLILADRYGGEIMRDAPLARLAAARRKAMTLRFARAAAWRLHGTKETGVASTATPDDIAE